MNLDLGDCTFSGPALPEPFVRFELGVMLAKHDDIGGETVNDLARTLANCKEILEEFASRQIQIKNVERGLIDFPAWRNGRENPNCGN